MFTKLVRWHVFVIPTFRKHRQEVLWGLLASQLSLLGKLQPNKETLSQKIVPEQQNLTQLTSPLPRILKTTSNNVESLGSRMRIRAKICAALGRQGSQLLRTVISHLTY